VARRLSDGFAVSAAAFGNGRKAILELGGVLMTSQAQLRIASLVSTDADYGALFQVNSTGTGNLAYNVELRRVRSADGKPLIPSSTLAGGPGLGRLDLSDNAIGSYSQASANLSFRLGEAQIGGVAAYRSDGRRRATYTFGPTLFMPILRRDNMQLTLQTELTRSNEGTGGFIGLRLQLLRAPLSIVGALGAASYERRLGTARRTRAVGQVDGAWQSNWAGNDVTISAGAERGFEGAGARLSAGSIGRYGTAHAGLLQTLEGGSQTQYSLNLQTGGALAGQALAIGGRETTESGIIVEVEGEGGATFEVLVNDTPRGVISPGERLPVFLTPYARYAVRVRPVDAPQLSFDGGDRVVSLYPGTVQALTWKAEAIQTIFGKVVRADGTAVANADITSSRGIGRTDPAGYFQVQVGADRNLALRGADGTTCKLEIGTMKQKADYASVGALICR
jgi:hypothetical protein